MPKSAFSVVAAGLGTLCAVLLFVEQTDTADAPKADFVHSIVKEQTQSITPGNMTQEQPAIAEGLASFAAELPGSSQPEEYLAPAISTDVFVSATVLPVNQVITNQPGTVDRRHGTSAPGTEQNEQGPDAVSNSLVIIVDEREIDVPPGAALPVAIFVSARLAESEPEYSHGQQEGTDRVAADFTNEVATADAKTLSASSRGAISGVSDLERWQAAVAVADERFRALLGDEIYNRELIRQHQLER